MNSAMGLQWLLLFRHPHGDTDNQHEGVPGYVYDSQACLSCHPDGEPPPEGRSRSRVQQKLSRGQR